MKFMLIIENHKNVVPLSLSEEADIGSGGNQPARNNLTDWNGKGERKFPNPILLFQSLMPKKTLCFDRNNMRDKTNINPKKGQHIPGQDKCGTDNSTRFSSEKRRSRKLKNEWNF